MTKTDQKAMHQKWGNKYRVPKNYKILASDVRRWERMEKETYRPFNGKSYDEYSEIKGKAHR